MSSFRSIYRKMLARRRRAQLFIDAAKMMEERRDDRSCCAVAFLDAGDRDEYETSPEAIAYRDFMLDGTFTSFMLPWGEGIDAMNSEHAMEIRVLLLCFMASAVETGDA